MDVQAQGMSSSGVQTAMQNMSHKDDRNCVKIITRSRVCEKESAHDTIEKTIGGEGHACRLLLPLGVALHAAPNFDAKAQVRTPLQEQHEYRRKDKYVEFIKKNTAFSGLPLEYPNNKRTDYHLKSVNTARGDSSRSTMPNTRRCSSRT